MTDTKEAVLAVESTETREDQLTAMKMLIRRMQDESDKWLARHVAHRGSISDMKVVNVIGQSPMVLRHMKCRECSADNEFKFQVRT